MKLIKNAVSVISEFIGILIGGKTYLKNHFTKDELNEMGIKLDGYDD